MRVLCITSSYPTALNTIAGNFVQAQIRCLQKYGVEIDVIATNMFSLKDVSKWIRYKLSGGDHHNCFYSGSMVNVLPFGPWFHKFWFKNTINSAIDNYIAAKGKPDLIHAHFNIWAGYATSQWKGIDAIPLVVTEHSSIYFEEIVTPLEITCTQESMTKARAVICLSEFLKLSLLKYFKASESKMTIIPNLVEETFFEKYDFNRKENMFVSIGRLVKPKGFETLLKAFALLSTNTDFKLVIVGDGEEMNNLKQLSEGLGISERVKFTGTLSKKSILELIRVSKILISCSHFETFGLSIAEALATGTPVLVTNVGAPSGFVRQSEGQICKVCDVDDTNRKLRFMIDNYSSYNHSAVREYALQSFGENAIAEKIISVYQNITRSN